MLQEMFSNPSGMLHSVQGMHKQSTPHRLRIGNGRHGHLSFSAWAVVKSAAAADELAQITD